MQCVIIGSCTFFKGSKKHVPTRSPHVILWWIEFNVLHIRYIDIYVYLVLDDYLSVCTLRSTMWWSLGDLFTALLLFWWLLVCWLLSRVFVFLIWDMDIELRCLEERFILNEVIFLFHKFEQILRYWNPLNVTLSLRCWNNINCRRAFWIFC